MGVNKTEEKYLTPFKHVDESCADPELTMTLEKINFKIDAAQYASVQPRKTEPMIFMEPVNFLDHSKVLQSTKQQIL